MTLFNRLAIAALVIGGGIALGFYFHSAGSQQPEEPPRPHKVTLHWDKAAHAKTYNIYRRPYRQDTFAMLGSSETTSYEDPTVRSAEIYCYVVTSVDSKGRESVHPREVCITVPHP
jgi:hypothetical protein